VFITVPTKAAEINKSIAMLDSEKCLLIPELTGMFKINWDFFVV
jgi:hypothetical protein